VTRFILEGYNQFNATYVRDVKGGLSIYTTYEIINSGSLEFPDTYNNAIFADIVRQKDTIRVYNVHLQSSKINTNVEALKNETSENLLNRLSSTFKAQQDQVELIKAHQKQSGYKTIITGDLNNTSYSYIYNELRGTFYDSFEEAGHGFGKTFNFRFFPLRIDFILLDNEAFRVINHETQFLYQSVYENGLIPLINHIDRDSTVALYFALICVPACA
jgi:vancomycin resistance protein VanJ